MSAVHSAYLAVIVIWSTTPLAIKWSTDGFTPEVAAFGRMAIAAVLGWLLLKVLRIPLPLHKGALLSYLAAVLGVYGAMMASYYASLYVTSGLLSVLWGTAPLVSGVLAMLLLPGEQQLTPVRWLSMLLGISGLGYIFSDDLLLEGPAMAGVAVLLFGVFCYSLSIIWVKRVDARLHPLSQTVGALILSLPFYVFSWWVGDGELPVFPADNKAALAVLYLAIAGSLVGFLCFYQILSKLPASTVALITLITPVFALLLGQQLNDEQITSEIVTGTGLIMLGLAGYHWGDLLLRRKREEVTVE